MWSFNDQEPSPKPIATNCLSILGISDSLFEITEQIKEELGAFGTIERFIPIKSFRRIYVIYEETTVAILAKESIEKGNSILGNNPVFFLDLEPFMNQNATLQLPVSKRNFLISPPGSPMDSWEQTNDTVRTDGGLAFLPEDLNSQNPLNKDPIMIENIDEGVMISFNSDDHIDLPSILIQDFCEPGVVFKPSKFIPSTSLPISRN